MNILKIKNQIKNNGFEFSGGKLKASVKYGKSIWSKTPVLYRKSLMNEITFAMTAFLGAQEERKIDFSFPQPISESVFFEGLIYSAPEMTLIGDETTTEMIKRFSNSFLQMSYQCGGNNVPPLTGNVNPNSAVVPFTFGKDSLLTFALMNELEFELTPVFIEESVSPGENHAKRVLEKQFTREFNHILEKVKIESTNLRQTSGLWWGWDLLMTQYSLILIPLLHAKKAGFLFWSNEKGCNESSFDDEGYELYPSFEQINRWDRIQSNMLRLLKVKSVVASPIESLQDIAVMRILHHRYPKYAKYQMSCWVDHGSDRWCGNCSKCARIAIFLLAVGVELKTVGLNADIISKSKANLYSIFGTNGQSGSFDKSGLGRDEQALAFLLAYKRGYRGGIFDEFAKQLPEVKKREKKLRQEFFSVYPNQTIPKEIFPKLEEIFKQELKELL